MVITTPTRIGLDYSSPCSFSLERALLQPAWLRLLGTYRSIDGAAQTSPG